MPYPEGGSDREHTYLFDGGQMCELLFVGFQTEAEEMPADRLARLERGAGPWPNGAERARSLSSN